MKQVQLGQMSFQQAAEAFKEKPVVLIPVGAIEAHGPHLPLAADAIVAEEVAVRAARQSPALVVPVVSYGYAAYWNKYPGNISVRASLVHDIVEDIIRSLLPFGLDQFIFVNNHSSNEESLELLAREFKAERGLLMAHFYPWRVMPYFCPDLYDDFEAASGHGAEPATSVMMYLCPDDVDMTLAVKDQVHDFKGFHMTGGKNVLFEGVPLELYVDMDEVNPSGVMSGNPLVATPERGLILLERTAAALAKFIHRFREMA